MWSEVLTESNTKGWGMHFNFTNDDAKNALRIATNICSNIAIKNGKIRTVEDADRIGDAIREFVWNNFGIDTTKRNENGEQESDESLQVQP